MSLKKIRRRLSQTFRFSIEGSFSEVTERLTIEDSHGDVKSNGNFFVDNNMKHFIKLPLLVRRHALSDFHEKSQEAVTVTFTNHRCQSYPR